LKFLTYYNNKNYFRFLIIARRLDIYVISLDVPYSADVKLHVNSYMNNVVDVAVDPIEGNCLDSDFFLLRSVVELESFEQLFSKIMIKSEQETEY